MEARAVRTSLRAVPDRPGEVIAYRQVASEPAPGDRGRAVPDRPAAAHRG